MAELSFDIEAYSPAQIAARVEAVAEIKANLKFHKLLLLGILAGVFIGFGALSYTLVVTGSNLGFGPTRLIGGIAFSVGLILVIIGGAELFTGNALMVMAWVDQKIPITKLIRNWVIVYLGNFIGAIGLAVLVSLSGVIESVAIADTVAKIAGTKLDLPASQAFFRGILCNILVCLAVWMSFAARRVSGKVLVIVFPIAMFVMIGFEHSVANMYVIPVAMIADIVAVDIAGLLVNLVLVTLGNIIGGAVFVALVYWLIYRYHSV